MCAGQWHEALKELTEAATQARTFSDHLWHAKALENIMVCLLLFAWAGMDFQVRSINLTILSLDFVVTLSRYRKSAILQATSRLAPSLHSIHLPAA